MVMKIIMFFFILSISVHAFADFMADREEVSKWETEEYLNDKNYSQAGPGKPLVPTKPFYDSVMNDPKKLKFFQFLICKYGFLDRYKKDRAFAIAIENKFSGKPLTSDEKIKVVRKMGQIIWDEPTKTHKEGFGTEERARKHLDSVMQKVLAEKF
jgi:hypothetical protein